MTENQQDRQSSFPPEADLKDEDIFEAMKGIPGYLDITPGDFKELYSLAYRHALDRLRRRVTAREVMTRDVIYVQLDTPVAEVAAAMGRRGVSGVPVLDRDGKVAGVISEKDFISQMGAKEPRNFMSLVAACLKAKGCVALPLKQQTAADLMNTPAVTVGEDTPLAEIAALLTDRNINRVPVTDAAGRLRGIVSRGDLIKAGKIW